MRDADCMRDLCQYTTVDDTHWKCNAVCGLHEGIMPIYNRGVGGESLEGAKMGVRPRRPGLA